MDPAITRETATPEAEEAAVADDDGRAGRKRRPPAGTSGDTRARRRAAAPGRPAPTPSDPSGPMIVQPGVRTIFVRQAAWKATAGMSADELASWTRRQHAAWLRRRRIRELVLLTMLHEHRYFTTEQLRALFFPSLRAAQLHLRWLSVEQRLVMRWPHYEPVVADPGPAPTFWGLRRRSSLFLLTELGALLVAAYRQLDTRAVVRRSFYTAERERTLEHTLETNGFWVSLAAAARELPDQGLYHWVGDDAMRRNHQERGIEMAPDGWGRYLVPGGEIRFSLEWDRGTEPPQRLSRKAMAFRAQPGAGGGNVLVVVPGATREQSVRGAIARELPERRTARFWSSHAGLLGRVWSEVGGSAAERVALTDLPVRPGSGLDVEDCIGKPGWWERRPGGGEGA
jgi:hypothetical protein